MANDHRLEVFTAIKNGQGLYYLLKVVRRGYDVYCIPPDLGIHYSLHESGQGHFRFEEVRSELGQEASVALIEGEAGSPIGGGIVRAPLCDLGRATAICTAIFPIDNLSNDFRSFQRNTDKCFVIDADSFPSKMNYIRIGVWAVPDRNQVSFTFNNPDVPEEMIYKIAHVEPQIWIYAGPFGG